LPPKSAGGMHSIGVPETRDFVNTGNKRIEKTYQQIV
jgi:hypothetical protein